jgi:hypothetical protein
MAHITVHRKPLTEVYAPTGETMTARVLWTDRPFRRCGLCDHEINRTVERRPVEIAKHIGSVA